MRELYTDIIIEAPRERVWSILANTGSYPEWNPFIRKIDGMLSEGQKLIVYIQPPGGKEMTFNPTCTVVTMNRELRWVGKMFSSVLFKGEHIFELEDAGQQSCRLIHRERFSGLLVPLFWKSLDTFTRRGFELMNEKIRDLAEASG